MPHPAKPKVAKCFLCKEWILIKYVPYYRRFSLKNDWNYWTQNIKEKNIKEKNIKEKNIKEKNIKEKNICDKCLKKNKDEMKKKIVSPPVLKTYLRYLNREWKNL